MSTLSLLLETKALIADPTHWIQGSSTAPAEDGGDCYCLGAAVARAMANARLYGSLGSADVVWAVARAILGEEADIQWPLGTVVSFNDEPGRKHEEIIAALDKAIAACQDRRHDD